MKVTSHVQGTPSWFELSTTDPEAAVEFYGQLFGWSDDPQPMPEGPAYHMQRLEGDAVAAISPQMPGEVAQGLPPHWNVYLTVDDVDATTGKGVCLAPTSAVVEVKATAVGDGTVYGATPEGKPVAVDLTKDQPVVVDLPGAQDAPVAALGDVTVFRTADDRQLAAYRRTR